MADRRLIEVAFPVKGATIDSAHEKKVRHGHISTLHTWSARLPLFVQGGEECKLSLLPKCKPPHPTSDISQ
ncbi:MAG: DUF1156 domain-containing protein [Armatimonadota bacterium]|nr:DUF1156 domain-containing protein [Armatimonadota bacterium]